jgi:hypothetical protein
MRRLIGAVAAIALLAVGGAAFAQTTGDERIYACVNNGDGTMRQVAGPNVACPRNWHTLSWSAENAPAPHIPVTTTYTQVGSILWDAGDVFGEAIIHCNGDDIAVSGGWSLGSATQFVEQSSPIFELGEPLDNTGWQFVIREFGGAGSAGVYVICQHTE